ncbi:MAG: transglutaminase-like domain-containing protein [Bacteroidota bacterium]
MNIRKWHYCSWTLVLAWFLGQSSPASAQPKAMRNLMEEYSGEAAVYLKSNRAVELEIVDGELIATEEDVEEALVIDDKYGIFSTREIYCGSLNEVSDIQAVVRIPEKSKYREVPVGNIERRSSERKGIFYEGGTMAKLTYPGMVPGAISAMRYRTTYTDARFLAGFWFQAYTPILEAIYSITFPETLDLDWKLFGEEQAGVKFSESRAEGKVTYTWTAERLPKMARESSAPSARYYGTHLVVFVRSAKIADKQVKYLDGVDGLYAWYQTFVQRIRPENDQELRRIAQEIVQNRSTDREKVAAIFAWVQANVRYVAYEDGWRGYIPYPAAEVCAKRYGDCKDMANLTREMLQAVGVDAQLTWIGTRELPYTYTDLPTPQTDNHMIAAVKLDGKIEFLDATDPFLPSGYPSSGIQGKQALVSVDRDNYELVTVPIVPAEANRSVDSIALRIRDGVLHGTCQAFETGYMKRDFLAYLRRDQDAKLLTYLQESRVLGNNKFSISEAEIDSEKGGADPLRVGYAFTVPDYLRAAAGRYYINLNLDKRLPYGRIDREERMLPVKFDYQYEVRFHCALEIPEGYALKALPETVRHTHPRWGMEMAYRTSNNSLVLEQNFYLRTLQIDPRDFAAWNDYITALEDAFRTTVVLIPQ